MKVCVRKFWRNKAEQNGTVEMADGLALNWWTGFV
jgi:hypothetical protein